MVIERFNKRILLSSPHMSGREQKYIQQAFDENWIVPQGPNVNAFEDEMITYLGETNLYAVAMSSGTAAIHIALRLMDIKQDEEVFCSSLTFSATANPILYEKAKPVFIDSEESTWNICADSLLKAIEEKKKKKKIIPRILIAVDLFGMPAEYERIEKICHDHNITLIEDAAEALGSTIYGKKCGTFGRFGILSFNGNKIITTSGGGMLICKNKEDAEKALFLITQARDKAPYYLHSHIGYNYRMSNICAGIGRGQLEVIEDRVAKRRAHFNTYKELLSPIATFKMQSGPAHSRSNHWLSTGYSTDKSFNVTKILNAFHELNIEARHVWKPLHTQPIFKGYEFYSILERPFSEAVFETGICLPSGSNMDQELVKTIAEAFMQSI